MCYNVRLYKALMYYYNWMFTNLEIFDKKKIQKKSENSKEKHFG